MKIFGAGASDEMAAIKAMFPDPVEKATWALQVNYLHRGALTNPFMGVQIWKKSAKGFGFSDELVRWCAVDGCLGHSAMQSLDLTPEEDKAITELGAFTAPEKWPASARMRLHTYMAGETACPKCFAKAVWRELPDSVGYSLPLEQLADALARHWDALEGDADLYLVKEKKLNGMQIARREMNTRDDWMPEYKTKLAEARDREQVYYQRARIIKDTASGKSVSSAILALLRA